MYPCCLYMYYLFCGSKEVSVIKILHVLFEMFDELLVVMRIDSMPKQDVSIP